MIFCCRIIGSCSLYDILLVHTKNIYEDFIDNIDKMDEDIFENIGNNEENNLALACEAMVSIQEGFGSFLCLQTSENAVFFTIWAYLATVDNAYIICAALAFTR